MEGNLAHLGFFWGAVSAVSLPIGALLGLWSRPPRRAVSGLMAFGGGALLFALTIELFGHALHLASDHHGVVTEPALIWITIAAAVMGGLLFEGLNRFLNSRGAAARKRAVLTKAVLQSKRKRTAKLLRIISRSDVLRSLDQDDVVHLAQWVEPVTFAKGDIIFREGDEPRDVYFISQGKVSIDIDSPDAAEGDAPAHVAVLGPGDILGEMALLTDLPRSATARATGHCELFSLSKFHFHQFLGESSKAALGIHRMAEERSRELADRHLTTQTDAEQWVRQTEQSLKRYNLSASEQELEQAAQKHGQGTNAASAIWLGIALDGIPESLVIGMLVVQAAARNVSMSLALIIGVFLANLPEAMSSAVTMKSGGMTLRKIMGMWVSLVLMTAVGASVGALVFPAHPEGMTLYFIYGIEGLAAGAMLTMIAETMLPEAFEQGGGTIAGLSTLAGFLAALSVKLIR